MRTGDPTPNVASLDPGLVRRSRRGDESIHLGPEAGQIQTYIARRLLQTAYVLVVLSFVVFATRAACAGRPGSDQAGHGGHTRGPRDGAGGAGPQQAPARPVRHLGGQVAPGRHGCLPVVQRRTTPYLPWSGRNSSGPSPSAADGADSWCRLFHTARHHRGAATFHVAR